MIKGKLKKMLNIINEIIVRKIKDNKKMIGKLLLIIFLLLIILVFIYYVNHDESIGLIRNKDAIKFENEYEELNDKFVDEEKLKKYPEINIPDDNKIKYSNVDEILEMFENRGSGVVYFGNSTCLYCRSAIEVLCNVASKTDLEVIYYIDVEKSEKKFIKKLFAYVDQELIINEEELYVPLVLFIVDGRVVSYNKGTLFSQEDPYIKLDDSQVQGLGEIYNYGINDVIKWIELQKNL